MYHDFKGYYASLYVLDICKRILPHARDKMRKEGFYALPQTFRIRKIRSYEPKYPFACLTSH